MTVWSATGILVDGIMSYIPQNTLWCLLFNGTARYSAWLYYQSTGILGVSVVSFKPNNLQLLCYNHVHLSYRAHPSIPQCILRETIISHYWALQKHNKQPCWMGNEFHTNLLIFVNCFDKLYFLYFSTNQCVFLLCVYFFSQW